MLKLTTKTVFGALLTAAIALPGIAAADVMHRAKSGAMVCPGNSSTNNYYYFTNNNLKKVIKITSIEISDAGGEVVKAWEPGSMPKGLPNNGVLGKRKNYAVQASEMAKGITGGKSPFRARVEWRITNAKIGTKPSIALVRNFKDGSVTVSQRASSCSSINPAD